MKCVITITGWRRPKLFRMLLGSLAANDLRGWAIFVQLEPSEFVEDYRSAADELISAVPLFFTVNSERLGIRINPYRLLDRVFTDGAVAKCMLEYAADAKNRIVCACIMKLVCWALSCLASNVASARTASRTRTGIIG